MGQPLRPIAAEQHIISLGRVLQSLREEDNVDVLIETIISFVNEQFDYTMIWVALYDRLNHILIGKGGVAPGGKNNFLNQRLVLSPGDLLEQVVIEQRPVGVPDLRAQTRAEGWQQLAQKHQIQGTIILPIRYKDRCLGLLLLGSSRWGYLLPTDTKARLMMVLGELAAALHQYEMNWQQKQTKRLEEPLLQLLQSLQSLTNLEQRLEVVVRATQQFIQPTRTHIYWFEREGRYFWRRTSSHQVGNGQRLIEKNRSSTDSITVEELSDFYYALAVNEIVAIGEGRSSLKSHFTAQLMQRLQVRSLLAAPIIWQKDLLGFLAVEGNEARIWKETDKNFVQGAAGLISLVAPAESMETTIQKIRDDAQLTSLVARGIYSERDFKQTLSNCTTQILGRLSATRFVLLQYNCDQTRYEILYQSQPSNRRALNFNFDGLREVDWLLLQRASEAIAVENLEDDLRFFNWRSSLIDAGVRSLLLTNCAPGNTPETLLLITHESCRAWTVSQRELAQVVSQQIGVITRQWTLHHNADQQQKIMQSFQESLRILEQGQSANSEVDNKHLETISLRQIASILSCPLAIMLSWMPGEEYAEILPGVMSDTKFAVKTEALVPIAAEALIQWALGTQGMLILKVEDLPEDTRRWLYGNGIGQVLVMAPRTDPDYESTSVVIMADHSQRHWSEYSLKATETLICQLAWSRRQKQVTQKLFNEKKELQQLNWYKHRKFEDWERHTASLISQIQEIGIPSTNLAQMRYQQMLRQLGNTNTSMTELLKHEQWQLLLRDDLIPITSLLKRSLERVDSLLKQQKLWVGVHGLGQNIIDDTTEKTNLQLSQYSLVVVCDLVKLELVVNELLVSACSRSILGGRIDFWCRRLDEGFLELSITDNGEFAPQLLTELYQDTPKDVLAFSHVDEPPGLHLLICQNLMQYMAGELHFYQLPDSRVVSRLLLPLAKSS